MALLARHLEQIALSSEAISSLPFPPPKPFTNALLSTLDITSLIRDTEPHERALFSVPPPPAAISARTPYQPSAEVDKNRRKTVFAVAEGAVTGMALGKGARGRAVKEVLGREMSDLVRKEEGREKVDLEILLRGVEKLDMVYGGEGVKDRVEDVRRRWGSVRGDLRVLEERVKWQEGELEGLGGEKLELGDESGTEVTEEDLRREEDEMRELEERKVELEGKIKGIEEHLGTLGR